MKAEVYGFEGIYDVDESGNIWSRRREKIINGNLCSWPAKQLSPFLDSNGYLYVNLVDTPRRKKRAIHRIVLEAFVGPQKEKMVACHADGNKLNNSLSNLRWDSAANNYADSVRHGTNAVGCRNGNAKLTVTQVLEILSSDEPSTTVCKKYGVASSTIRAIRINQNWKSLSKGFTCREQSA